MADLTFRTILDRKKITSIPGDRFADTYSLKVQDSGEKTLEKTGKVDVYAKIQSYKDSCDIHVILERFVNGDESALSANSPSFGDFTQFPTTYAEVLQRQHDAEQIFMDLPVDVRAEFKHSASEFFTSIGTDKFNAVMDKYYKTDPVDPVDPVDPGQPVVPVQPAEPVVTPGGDVDVQKPE